MRVLQFGFGDSESRNHLPHRFVPSTVSYTGTHDNDTTLGWWQGLTEGSKIAVQTYVGEIDGTPVWPLIRASATSVSEMAIVPAQDLLLLGSEARMNTPAVAGGNWSWRACENAFTDEIALGLSELVEMTDRDFDPILPVGSATLASIPS